VTEKELTKVKNKTESVMAFEDMSVMSRAGSLAYYEWLGDATLMNTELERYQEVTVDDIRRETAAIFRESNSSTLYYRAASGQEVLTADIEDDDDNENEEE
jgi:predicted Zn-dependent peptidase